MVIVMFSMTTQLVENEQLLSTVVDANLVQPPEQEP